MNKERYIMSFTTGGLFRCESVKLAEMFVELKDWNQVQDRVISNNLLQARTLNTSKRVGREITSRLKTLSPQELCLLVSSNPHDVCE